MSDLTIGGLRLVPVGGEPSALSAPPDVVMQRARAAVGAAEPEELSVGGMRLVPQAGPLASETVVPKGGEPRQLRPDEEAAWGLYDRMMSEPDRASEMTAGQNFIASAGKRVAGNVMGLPSLAVDLMTAPLRPGQPFGVTPQLEPEHVAAGIEAVTGPKTYGEALEGIEEREAVREETFPKSTLAGNVAGDVFSLATGRLPIAKTIVGASKTAREAQLARAAAKRLPKGPRRIAARVMNSPIMQKAVRTAGKAGETSLEGATLSMLNEGDPVKTAAYAGGGQLAGTLAASLVHNPKTAGGALIGGVILWQYLQNVVPGGKDWIINTTENVIDKMTVASVLGVGAQAIGAGRFRGAAKGGEFAKDAPKLAEGINAALRGNPISLIEQMTSDRKAARPLIGPVMQKLQTDASVFKPDEINRLAGGLKSGKLRETIETLARNEDFRTRMGMQ